MRRSSKKSLWKIISIALSILILLLIYWRAFEVSNWREYYWGKKTWAELFNNPESHIKPAIEFIIVVTLIISVGVVTYFKQKRK